MRNSLYVISLFLFLIYGCKQTQEVVQTRSINLDTLDVLSEDYQFVYHASQTRINDIVHTKLDVRFDWEQQRMMGKAWIIFKPYFYPTANLTLDAKGFDIN